MDEEEVQVKNKLPNEPSLPRKTILITYASTGFGFKVVEQYLKNNYNVVIHSVDPVMTEDKLDDHLSAFYGQYLYAQGRLDDDFTNKVLDRVDEKFGQLDTVIHFAITLHKVAAKVGTAENLRFLFKENIQPILNLYRRGIERNQYMTFIAIPPVLNPSVKFPNIGNIEEMYTWLQFVVEEMDDKRYGTYGVVLDPKEFKDLKFEEPSLVKDVAKVVWNLHQKLNARIEADEKYYNGSNC
ncbi:hypothetical protein M3Y94_00709700 [Aphelenchoides besseyi]|nr:hypothetical protein M3Y94_00709700 [Aphelenchoides besseyi]KAI6231696.1 hypothetical protein M3Y95_00409000 [Aphelenchoides besseyi]